MFQPSYFSLLLREVRVYHLMRQCAITGWRTVFSTCLMTSRFMLEREVRSTSYTGLAVHHTCLQNKHTLDFALNVQVFAPEEMP